MFRNAVRRRPELYDAPGFALARHKSQVAGMFGGKVRDVTARRWAGVAYMPSKMGYVTASRPLGVLEVAPGRIELRVRLPIARWVFGIDNLDVTAGQGAVVFPTRRLSGLDGIEIRVPGRPSSYFWNTNRSEVLVAVAAAGFEVSDQEQTMKPH